MHHTRLARGFTLVEMLVVVVIIGMMAVGALLALDAWKNRNPRQT